MYSYIKCRYLSGIKKKHTKAPISLHFTALEENNFMKNTKRRSIKPESGTPAITEVFEVEFLSLLLMFTQRCYDSLRGTLQQHCLRAAQLMHLRSLWQPEWHHVTVKDNQSQSMGQCWETKKHDKDQITYYASCHFYSCIAKNVCVCFMFACFSCLPLSYCLCKPVMTVCRWCIGCTGGEEECLLFF